MQRMRKPPQPRTPSMKVQFVLNVPQTLALQDPSGEYNEAYNEVSYPCVDERILALETRAAERLNALFLRPGESFAICRRWNHEKGTIPYIDIWLCPASEQRRAAEETARQEAPAAASSFVAAPAAASDPPAPRKRQKRQKVQEMPNPPVQPGFWDGRGNGTYGPVGFRDRPTPQPAIASAHRPPKIPYNVAFREVVQFVTAGLKEAGEQWSDAAKQDMISTVLISASQQGLLQLWERP